MESLLIAREKECYISTSEDWEKLLDRAEIPPSTGLDTHTTGTETSHILRKYNSPCSRGIHTLAIWRKKWNLSLTKWICFVERSVLSWLVQHAFGSSFVGLITVSARDFLSFPSAITKDGLIRRKWNCSPSALQYPSECFFPVFSPLVTLSEKARGSLCVLTALWTIPHHSTGKGCFKSLIR